MSLKCPDQKMGGTFNQNWNMIPSCMVLLSPVMLKSSVCVNNCSVAVIKDNEIDSRWFVLVLLLCSDNNKVVLIDNLSRITTCQLRSWPGLFKIRRRHGS